MNTLLVAPHADFCCAFKMDELPSIDMFRAIVASFNRIQGCHTD